MRSASLAMAAMAAAVVSSACAKDGQAPPASPAPGVERRAAPAGLPAGTELTVVLHDALSTGSSIPGETFRATVLGDVRSPDGTVVLPGGAAVYGTVARVQRGEVPVLALDFYRVDTDEGSATIHATLAGAQRVPLRDPFAAEYDALLAPRGDVGPFGYAAPPTSVYYVDHLDEAAREIRLAVGTRLRLELAQPLVVSGG